ncbi:hypothetical protein R3W88_007579 [Solanum pinnatisectum]|uniref:Uncharacterized protein n=1 Tax=Solanum pinnatisectum TaxID=50273 RepID=A0AAV9M665_9SOLN|nr:hypothetical protein R3W88_007579 [Solanum pinnatisectum]
MGQCVSSNNFTCEENRSAISWRHKDYQRQKLDNKKHKVSSCYAMIKEQRSRFYIIRRCIIMLIFWHRYSKI